MPKDSMKACSEELARILDYYGVGQGELGLGKELWTLIYRAYHVGMS